MKSNKYFFLLLIGGIFLASCVPQKKITYLQSQSDDDSVNTYVNERKLDYRIQPGDNLYIRINSLEERSTAYFNQGKETGAGGNNLYLTSYLVSDSGYFNFPSLGFLYVKDMTAEEIQYDIEQRLVEYLKDPVVTVSLSSFRITLLGEFNSPGKYDVYQNNINIFEAISMGGDLTDFAKRTERSEEAVVVRVPAQTSNKQFLRHISLFSLSATFLGRALFANRGEHCVH